MCDLCDHPGGEMLWQDDLCRVVLVAEPDYPGFCRVIWNRHVKEMTDLPEAQRQHAMQVVFATESAVREVLQPDKINLASLGNMVPHIHWHVIPRHRLDRHFPNAIWGEAQREARPAPPANLADRLSTALAAALQPAARSKG